MTAGRLYSEGSSLRRQKAQVAGTSETEVRANGRERKKLGSLLRSHCSCYRYTLALYLPVSFYVSIAAAALIGHRDSSGLGFSLTSQQR